MCILEGLCRKSSILIKLLMQVLLIEMEEYVGLSLFIFHLKMGAHWKKQKQLITYWLIHTVPLTVGDHQFMSLILRKLKTSPKKKMKMMKIWSSLFILNSPHCPVMNMLQILERGRNIKWYQFVRRTHSIHFLCSLNILIVAQLFKVKIASLNTFLCFFNIKGANKL